MGNEHSHSHNGQPCHGHGDEGHGHSHGGHSHSHGQPAPQHGHSHNGKPCHGHGGGHGHSHAQPAPQHGHSHNGKPCHGHGGGHGHSHAQPAPQHGHSHNGKPCHGHGGAGGGHGHSHGGHGHGHGHGQEQQSPEALKKQRGAQLFVETMLRPKMPIIWAKFHPNPNRDESKSTTSGGLTVPYCNGEFMSRKEFRDFITAFLQGQVNSDGYGVIRIQQAIQHEAQFLSVLGFGKECRDPDQEVNIPFEQFNILALQVLSRLTLTAYDTVPFILSELGLGAMKLPKLPLLAHEYELFAARQHCREQILPHLIDFINESAEENKEETNEAIRSGFVAVVRSIYEGLKEQLEANQNEFKARGEVYDPDEVGSNIMTLLTELPSLEKQAIEDPEEVLGLLKVHPLDEHIHPNLIAYNTMGPFLLPMLMHEPENLVYVLKRWGIDFIVQKEGEHTFNSTKNPTTPATTETE